MADLRPRHVARALNIPGTTLQNWIKSGLCPAFSAFPPGQHRRFNWKDLVHVAAMRGMVALGVPLEDAARIAEAEIDSTMFYFWRTPEGWNGGGSIPMSIESYGCIRLIVIAARLQRHFGGRLPALALAAGDAA